MTKALADVNKYNSELDEVLDELIRYLDVDSRLKGLIQKFYNEWPEANEGEFENVFSCHVVKAGLVKTYPKLLKTEPITGDAIKVAALFGVGQYDIDVQVDIWTPYKANRAVLYKKFSEAVDEEFLTTDNGSSGLSLTLANYFDTIARYEIVGYNFPDDERSSQTDEWRVKVDLKVHFDKKLEKVYNKIVTPIIVDKDAVTDEEYISEHIIII